MINCSLGDEKMTQADFALSEAVEAQIVRDLWATAPKDIAAKLGYEVTQVGDALVSAAAGDSSILINRTFALDINNSAATTSKVLDIYERLGVAKYFIHVNPDPPESLITDLSARGLVKGRAWMKFRRDASPVATPNTDLIVKEVTIENAEAFGQITAPCFGMTSDFGHILAAAALHDNWHVFMAFDGDQPAGCGCLVTHGGVGLLDMGATHPDFRRRGVQGAVMATRINKAAELGLKKLFTETGEAIEGEAQHSYDNILRYGFREWYARQNYMPS